MPTNGQDVKIAHYTRSKFNSLTNKDSATIYYVEETDGKIKQYIGNTHVVSDNVPWTGVSGKPTWIGSSKPSYSASEVGAAPTSHTHSIAQVTGLQTALDGKGTSNLTIGTTSTTAKAGNYQPTWSQVTSKPTWIGSSKPTYTASEVGARPAGNVPWAEVSGKPSFATVATSGSYNDLTNKPSIPGIPSVMTTTEGNTGTATTQRTINAANLKSIILNHSPAGSRPASDVSSWAKASSKPTYTATEVGARSSSWTPTWAQVSGKPSFATVATSGSYNDLTNKPSIPAAQVQSNWNATSGMGVILNKPALKTVATSGSYNDLSNKLTPGTNITIDANNVISASGGGTYELTKPKIETALSGSSTNSIQLGSGTIIYGDSAIAIGLSAYVDGDSAIAIGSSAFSEGSHSIALGRSTIAEGSYITALGSTIETVGDYVTAVGYGAKAYSTSSTALGYNAEASGSYATALGYGASAGASSTAVGRNTTASGNFSTAVGRQAFASGSSSTALGYGASAGSSPNTMRLGSTSLAALQSQVQLSVTSDIRDKADILEIPKALDFIKDLNPITYVGNDRDHYISDEQKETEIYKNYLMVEDYDKESHSQGTKKGERRRVGLSAQEVRDKLIEHYGSDNYANVVNDNFVDFEERGLDIPEGLENKLTMSYGTMVPFLIKAIQEQQEQIEELKKQTNSNLS